MVKSTSLISTPSPFRTGLLSQVSKNDDEKTLFLSIIWLYIISRRSIQSTQISIENWVFIISNFVKICGEENIYSSFSSLSFANG